MSVDRVLAILSNLLGAVAVAIAIVQTARLRQTNRVVADWGHDIVTRIGRAHAQLAEFRSRVQSISPVQWSQAQTEISNSIAGRADDLSLIEASMKVFLTNVTGDSRPSPGLALSTRDTK